MGRFRTCAILGEGGQGIVYRGEHVELGYPVAIKIIHGDEATELTRARFRREARLGAQVQHPNVVRVLELGELDDASPYLVMEYVNGISLSTLIAERTLSPDAAVDLGVQLLSALAALHARGIVHRDIKPENVMIERGIDSVTAKILDFGISKTSDRELEPATLTRAGTIVGTPSYMSPEHVRGERLDVRSDLYAVAGVLYETISGKPPHEAPTTSALFAKIATEPVRPLRAVAPSCPREVADVIDRGLRHERCERWPHPLAMSEALRAAAHELGLARGADAWTEVLHGASSRSDTVALELTRKRREVLANARTESAEASHVLGGMRFRVVIGAVAVMAAASLAAAIALLATRPDERVDTPPASKTPATATTTAAIALEPAPPEPTPPEVRAEGAAAGEPVPPPPDEEDLDAMEREARVAFVRGEGERSARLFRRIVERAPERASAWRGLGLVALAYGDHREARRALERYLELAPDARDRRRMERELRALR